jgi:hypothetical protein
VACRLLISRVCDENAPETALDRHSAGNSLGGDRQQRLRRYQGSRWWNRRRGLQPRLCLAPEWRGQRLRSTRRELERQWAKVPIRVRGLVACGGNSTHLYMPPGCRRRVCVGMGVRGLSESSLPIGYRCDSLLHSAQVEGWLSVVSDAQARRGPARLEPRRDARRWTQNPPVGQSVTSNTIAGLRFAV